jgi:hypothetical protein
MAGAAGFEISPQDGWATSQAQGGNVLFAPVNIGAASTKDRAVYVVGAVVVAVLLLALMRKR